MRSINLIRESDILETAFSIVLDRHPGTQRKSTLGLSGRERQNAQANFGVVEGSTNERFQLPSRPSALLAALAARSQQQ